MGTYTHSQTGESVGPPSDGPSKDDVETTAKDAASTDIETPAAEPGATKSTTGRVVDEAAKLVDIAFLIDCADRREDVLKILCDKLIITEAMVREKHAGVSIRAAFVGSYSCLVVADPKRLHDKNLREAISVTVRQGSAGHAHQDVLRRLEEVLNVGWSAGNRLLVHVSDTCPPTSEYQGEANEINNAAALSFGRTAVLQRLRKECCLQLYYFAYLDASTWQLIGELQPDCGDEDGSGWLVSEQLDEPEALPRKVAELVLELLDEAARGQTMSAAAAEAEEVPSQLTEEQPVQRSPSLKSETTTDCNIILPLVVGFGSSPSSHRYRTTSEDGTGPGAAEPYEECPPSEGAGTSWTTRQDARPSATKTASGGAGSAGDRGGSGGDNGASAGLGSAKSIRTPSDAGSGPSGSRTSGPSLVTNSSRGSSKSGSLFGGAPRSTRASDVSATKVAVRREPSEAGSDRKAAVAEASSSADTDGSRTLESSRPPSVASSTKVSSHGNSRGQSETSAATVASAARPSRIRPPSSPSSRSAWSASSVETDAGQRLRKPSLTQLQGAGIDKGPLRSGSSLSAESSRCTDSRGDRAPPWDAGSGRASRKGDGPGPSGPGSGWVTPTSGVRVPSEAASASQLSGHRSGPSSSSAGPAGASAAGALPGMLGGAADVSGPAALSQRKTATAEALRRSPALPWSTRALEDFKGEMRNASFMLLDSTDEPLTARLDSVFSMPRELWPVLPPGAMYCLEASDPRVTFGYLQHRDFPTTKVRLATYFGKWSRHLVDYVVSWQHTPRAEAAWQLADGKQPPLPWEQRQVVAQTTNGEYQYGNTRMRFRGPKTAKPDAEMVEYSDAHGVDLTDTKAANETAPRNSDKDRDAHLIDPPRPNTWGELARRPLISNLRSRGGGTYVHHVNYDHSSLRTTCGRRVPAGYFFNLIPAVLNTPPSVPGGPSSRPSSGGRSISTVCQARSFSSVTSSTPAALPAAGALRDASPLLRRMRSSSGKDLLGRPAPAAPSLINGEWSGRRGSTGAQPVTAPKAAAAAVAGLDIITLAPKQHWRTYDVPFQHPIHSARAQELGAEEAKASGRGVRTFSDAAAVMKVAEQELRLARAFVPGPLVVPTWDDIPRLYAEHMEAARALMPVTELDTYGSSKLHILIYHLQSAATLEYDRLDAKLLLLPQMARMGRKSVEIDAWLQATVEHASYLYDKLQIHDGSVWAELAAAATGSVDKGSQPLLRRSLAALPPPPPPPAAVVAAAPVAAPGPSQGWVFPDPLKDTMHASISAVNVAFQPRQVLREQMVPVQRVTKAEWSSVAGIMDPTRHASLYATWARLRPLMTGSATHVPVRGGGGGVGGHGGSPYSPSLASSMNAEMSEAGATVSGFSSAALAAIPDPYSQGVVNREVLDYLHKDLETMASPGFVRQPPTAGKKPKQRGYRGEGPLPPELVAEMPTVHRPVRCRGVEETPLPLEFHSMDLWNVHHKTELAPSAVPHTYDAGAVRSSQVAVHRLQSAREFAVSRQAAIRKSMQLAKGVRPSDEPDAPYYGSDIAEDEHTTDMSSEVGNGLDTPRRLWQHTPTPRKSVSVSASNRPGIATQTTNDLGKPTFEEIALRKERERAAAEVEEARKQLKTAGGSRSRDQVLDDALHAAEAAIRSLQPRPVGSGITLPAQPDDPRQLYLGDEPLDVATAYRPQPLAHSHPEVLSNPWYKRTDSISSTRSMTGVEKGPEPFSLEKLFREPSERGSDIDSGVEAIPLTDLPTAKLGTRGRLPIPGFLGLADYEMALARRRAIAGAELVQMRTNFIPKEDVFNLLVVYCNLERYPEEVEVLKSTVGAPVSMEAVSAAARAAAATAAAVGPAAAAVAAAAAAANVRKVDLEAEAERQRIRTTAWLLGVTWRRINNETYTSFLCRVLGWPAEVVYAMSRTRATYLIARVLVRGHDMESVLKTPPRY